MEQSDSEQELKIEIKKLREEINSLEKKIKKLEAPNGCSLHCCDNDRRYADTAVAFILLFIILICILANYVPFVDHAIRFLAS